MQAHVNHVGPGGVRACPPATGYEKIKDLARACGLAIPDLLALSRNNDPFFAGSPAQQAKAEWFAGLWQRFGFTDGVHLRRVHYRVVVEGDVTRHDGKPYANTEGCWGLLGEAGKMARYLGLVRPDAFVDHRNPEPTLVVRRAERRHPHWWCDEPVGWSLPEIQTDLGGRLSLGVPGVLVGGYDYAASDQPYLVEVWIEKTTMDDVLLPLCRGLNANLVPSAGFQSITAVVNLLARVAHLGKPARVFYVSDFDPAGDQMPVAVARQLEYWGGKYAPDADVKLTPLALTRRQAEEFRLPRVPIKETDRRKAGFEETHGTGAVELDALEALHPGSLAQIVRRAVAPYRDRTLPSRLRGAEEEAEELARGQWEGETAEVLEHLKEIEEEARAVAGDFEARLLQMNEELQARLGPLRERLQVVRHAMQQAQERFGVNLPDRPEPEMATADEADWLFDASRSYTDQLVRYKARKAIAARTSSKD